MNRNDSLGTFGLFLISIFTIQPAVAEKWLLNSDPKGFQSEWNDARYLYRLDQLPLEGAVSKEATPWADSYWPKNRGAFTYRWLPFQESQVSQHLTASDRQRLFFDYRIPTKKEVLKMSRQQLAELSPLEKYSIVIGDFDFKLVKEYRLKNSANDEYWEGYCHAWSAASAHYSEPIPVDVDVKIDGQSVTIPFGSGDVKALLTANYADLDGWSNFSGKINGLKRIFSNKVAPKVELRFVGGMCNKTFFYPTTKIVNGVERFTDYAETDGVLDSELETLVRKYQQDALRLYGNKNPSQLTFQEAEHLRHAKNPNLAYEARLNSQDLNCSDTNAGAFHVVMSNMLGLQKKSFLIDKTRDAEIWNQPVYRFESEIVKYQSPNSKSAPGTEILAEVNTKLYYADDTDYGWTFWNPTLAGMFGIQEYFTSFMDEYQKYQDMLIREGDLDEHALYPEHVVAYANYRYFLELDRNQNIIGGQWITLDRPDDLYIVKKSEFAGAFSQLGKIYRSIKDKL
jgi:hypothetical protein